MADMALYFCTMPDFIYRRQPLARITAGHGHHIALNLLPQRLGLRQRL